MVTSPTEMCDRPLGAYRHAPSKPSQAVLVFNPNAGHKLGVDTNSASADDVQAALREAGIPFDPWPTERAGHATDLARQAVAEGRELVIAAGGDGTVNEVARGLANTQTVLGLMPLGSIMNVARTLWVPRDLAGAARTIAEGKVLAMDMGRIGDRFFLEAAGVGLDAGLFGYFDRARARQQPAGRVARRRCASCASLGSPRITLEYPGWTPGYAGADGQRRQRALCRRGVRHRARCAHRRWAA